MNSLYYHMVASSPPHTSECACVCECKTHTDWDLVHVFPFRRRYPEISRGFGGGSCLSVGGFWACFVSKNILLLDDT